MRTLTPATIRALDYIAGTDELDVSNNNVQRLSDAGARRLPFVRARPEVVWFAEGMPLLSRFRYNYSFAETQNSR